MRTTVVQVSDLACKAGMSAEDAALSLMVAGIDVNGPTSIIPKRDMHLSRQVLGMPIQSGRDIDVKVLAIDVGLQEEIVRDVLTSCGLLPKRRLRRVPKHLVKEARKELAKHLNAQEARAVKKVKRDLRKEKESLDWPTVGKPEPLLYLTADDVEAIHWSLVEEYATTRKPIDPPGVRDRKLLESAMCRLYTATRDRRKYVTVAMAGSALLHAIAHNHSFGNGNKRTAFVATIVFLDKNGWAFRSIDEEELALFMEDVGAHRLLDRKRGTKLETPDAEMIHISEWLQRHMRLVEKGEHPLRFRDLRRALLDCECETEFAKGDGNRMNVIRGELRAQLAYSGDGKEVSVNSIHKLRRELELDSEHGCDSAVFYNQGERTPAFIAKYRGALDRLA